jgi:hypothetical protein
MQTGRGGLAALRGPSSRWGSRLAAAFASVPVWAFLCVLVAAEWLVVGAVAVVTEHNGSIYYNGGDDSWYYTSAWVLGNGHVPQSSIGYGYPFLIAPIARLAGPNLLAGAPFVVVFNAVVLWPVALLCVYGLAKAVAGRGFAYAASLLWAVLPLLAIPYFRQSYHYRYLDVQLPSSLGLTALADFPSMVFLLVAAYFALKAVARRSGADALVCGAAAGFAAAIKPSNLIFLPAPLAAMLVARRPREAGLVALGLAPTFVGLVVWKYRGLGYVPAFSSPPSALASGLATALPVGGLRVHKYLALDWSHLRSNLDYIREFTWSLDLLIWIVVAGVVGLARRSLPAVVLAGGWLACFLVLKGTSSVVTVSGGNFFRYMTPAFPAFFLLCASLPLLVPVLGRRLIERGKATGWADGRRTRVTVLTVAGVLTFLPIVTVALERPLTAPAATKLPNQNYYVPANRFPLTVKWRENDVWLSWPSSAAAGARPVYGVIREPRDGLSCPRVAHAAAACTYYDVPIAKTMRTTWHDRPPRGRWVYRVAVTVSIGSDDLGDVVMLSKPATADFRRS